MSSFVRCVPGSVPHAMKRDEGPKVGDNVLPMPWFGMDIGGTLTKLVYFEPCPTVEDHESEIIGNIRRYLTASSTYGLTGHRDVELQLEVSIANRQGMLHFIRFPTSDMVTFLELAKRKELAKTSILLFATGGGAYKFENAFLEEVGLQLVKLDELETLTSGIIFMEEHNPHELFHVCDENSSPGSCPSANTNAQDDDVASSEAILGLKVKYDFLQPYPFLVVNIGSGVSILSVRGIDSLERVSGSSLGGGTFFGLCCLLTGCKSYEAAIELAAKGDSNKVDKLVKDIYGGDYERFQLPGNVVAASFGQMNSEVKRESVSKADLARATLVTVTNNIGSIALMVAKSEGIDKVLFVGNFLRINPISMKLLSRAMDYWSNGKSRALFLEHEGYFGAIGCLIESVRRSGWVS